MPKSNPFVTQSYYLGEKPVTDFIKKELGSGIKKYANVNNRIDSIGKPDKNSKAYNLFLFRHFRNYREEMRDLYLSEARVIDKDKVESLLSDNKSLQQNKLFKGKLTWSSPHSKNAIAKYTDMLLTNDHKKLEYYQACLKNSDKPVLLKNVLGAPTPERGNGDERNIRDLLKNLQTLEEKLNKTEGRFHSNSPEYTAMMTTIKTFREETRQKGGAETEAIGRFFETLQAVTMDYINAKGVGTQVSKRGIVRMDAALDICGIALKGMDYVSSKDRREAVANFEKENFGKVITNGTLNMNAINAEKLKDDSELDDSMEEGMGYGLY